MFLTCSIINLSLLFPPFSLSPFLGGSDSRFICSIISFMSRYVSFVLFLFHTHLCIRKTSKNFIVFCLFVGKLMIQLDIKMTQIFHLFPFCCSCCCCFLPTEYEIGVTSLVKVYCLNASDALPRPLTFTR